MMCNELKKIVIFNTKGIDYRCILQNMAHDKAFNLSNNSKLDKKVSFKWNLPHIKSFGTIKEGAFGKTFFRDIYLGIDKKWYKNSWREFNELKNIDHKYYHPKYYDVKLNIYKVKSGTPLRFWENKGWINEIDPYGCFQWYFRYFLGRRFSDYFRQINRWK